MRINLCVTPEEGRWFRVIPQNINRQMLELPRTDKAQEVVRQAICHALADVDFNPRYYKAFYTTYPKKTWQEATMQDLIIMASKIGDGIVDFNRQALEWGQRLTNGESWTSVCNDADKANYYRLVRWFFPGVYKRIGGAAALGDESSSSCLMHYSCKESSLAIADAVPAICKEMHR